MTITMTSKNQVTIPKKVTDALGIKSGAMFEVIFSRSGIELVPLETRTRHFTDEEYSKLEKLSVREKGQEKKISRSFISKLKKGKI